MQIGTRCLKAFLLYTAVLFAPTGCAATGPSFTSVSQSIPTLSSNQARLYFMRDSSFMNSGLTARVRLNGVNVANLNMGGFVYADRPAGAVQIMIDAPLNTGDARKSINMEAGKTYYFLVSNNESNVIAGSFGGLIGALAEGGGRFVFAQISEASGLEQLKTKKLSGG